MLKHKATNKGHKKMGFHPVPFDLRRRFLNAKGVTSNLPRLNVGSTLNGWLRISDLVDLKQKF